MNWKFGRSCYMLLKLEKPFDDKTIRNYSFCSREKTRKTRLKIEKNMFSNFKFASKFSMLQNNTLLNKIPSNLDQLSHVPALFRNKPLQTQHCTGCTCSSDNLSSSDLAAAAAVVWTTSPVWSNIKTKSPGIKCLGINCIMIVIPGPDCRSQMRAGCWLMCNN